MVTFDGRPAAEDWYAVEFDAPVAIRRVVFAHGKTFHDGGWFDASGGKPQVQVKRNANAAWETVATLEDYPATTATESRGLEVRPDVHRPAAEAGNRRRAAGAGQARLRDNPQQAFSSCAELQAFGEP